MTEIPIDDIHPNPNQPRRSFDLAALGELAASIRHDGLLVPILVRPAPAGGYEIVHGQRRWRACRLAGFPAVRAEVREISDADALRLALVENLQREPLTLCEEAAALRDLLSTGVTQ